MQSTSQIQFEKFLQNLKALTDNELIEAFNKEVGNSGWVSARGAYLSAMHTEFKRRKFDYSQIGDERSLSLANHVRLGQGKLHIYVNEM